MFVQQVVVALADFDMLSTSSAESQTQDIKSPNNNVDLNHRGWLFVVLIPFQLMETGTSMQGSARNKSIC